MRIAFLADIHGNLPALEAVVADLRVRQVDSVICLGDHLSGPLLPLETARCLMKTDWLFLAGNHERQLLEFESKGGGVSDAFAHSQLGEDEWEWIRSMQSVQQVNRQILACHGTPRSDCEHFLFSVGMGALMNATLAEAAERLGDATVEIVACGHSHLPRVMRIPTGPLLLNPGSVGLQAYEDNHPEQYKSEVGNPDARYAIAERHGTVGRPNSSPSHTTIIRWRD